MTEMTAVRMATRCAFFFLARLNPRVAQPVPDLCFALGPFDGADKPVFGKWLDLASLVSLIKARSGG